MKFLHFEANISTHIMYHTLGSTRTLFLTHNRTKKYLGIRQKVLWMAQRNRHEADRGFPKYGKVHLYGFGRDVRHSHQSDQSGGFEEDGRCWESRPVCERWSCFERKRNFFWKYFFSKKSVSLLGDTAQEYVTSTKVWLYIFLQILVYINIFLQEKHTQSDLEWIFWFHCHAEDVTSFFSRTRPRSIFRWAKKKDGILK